MAPGNPACHPAGVGVDVACTSLEGCAPGGDCVAGQCVELCCPGRGDTACTVGGTACVSLFGTFAGYCLANQCDIGTQAGCGAGEGCYEVSEGVFSCLPTLNEPDGSDCTALNECAPGMACNTTSGSCAPYCHPTLLPACPAGRACQDFANIEYRLCRGL